MKVFIEGKEISVFSGATLADALRAYSEIEYKKVLNKKKNIFDAYDNMVDISGSVSNGSKYFLRRRDEKI